MGAKKAPFYRIVVADSRYPRDGRFVEEIGYYDPTKNPSVVKVDADKAKDWIKKGDHAAFGNSDKQHDTSHILCN